MCSGVVSRSLLSDREVLGDGARRQLSAHFAFLSVACSNVRIISGPRLPRNDLRAGIACLDAAASADVR